MADKIIFERGASGYFPTQAHPNDAGYDLYYPETGFPGQHCRGWYTVDVDVRILIPPGYVGFVCGRSGLASKHILVVPTLVVDAEFTGTIKVTYQVLTDDFTLQPGDRFAQIVFLKLANIPTDVGIVHNVKTARGNNGYGSSGK